MSSLMDRAKSGMDSLGSFLGNLPVIGDYRDKETRREADERLREGVARRLESYRRKLTGLQRHLTVSGMLQQLPDLDALPVACSC